MRALCPVMSGFATDRRGNIAVIFALALLPIMSAIGCTVDYSRATQVVKTAAQRMSDERANAFNGMLVSFRGREPISYMPTFR